RTVMDDFVQNAEATVICSGGIGANFELIRKNWSKRLGTAPQNMIAGVPDYVDGRMLGEAENIGAYIVNRDRMWHYTEGIQNWNTICSHLGIRILPCTYSLWFDEQGTRFYVILHTYIESLIVI